MSDEIVKICKIHGPLTIEQTRKDGHLFRCTQCRIATNKKSYDINREKRVAYSIKWKKENRPHHNEWERQDRILHPEKYKRYEENYIKKHGRVKVRKMEVARIHGLTVEQYDLLFKEQNHKCKICGLEETRKGVSGDITPLCVDHCHLCRGNGHLGLKNVRALLCHECNKGLGGFKDDIELLLKAVNYLQNHIHL
jgi:hypothetical protein